MRNSQLRSEPPTMPERQVPPYLPTLLDRGNDAGRSPAVAPPPAASVPALTLSREHRSLVVVCSHAAEKPSQ